MASFAYSMRLRMRGSRGGADSFWTPQKTHTAMGFLSNAGPDPLENHTVTKPAFNDGLLLVIHLYLNPLYRHQLNKIVASVRPSPPLTKLQV